MHINSFIFVTVDLVQKLLAGNVNTFLSYMYILLGCWFQWIKRRRTAKTGVIVKTCIISRFYTILELEFIFIMILTGFQIN